MQLKLIITQSQLYYYSVKHVGGTIIWDHFECEQTFSLTLM